MADDDRNARQGGPDRPRSTMFEKPGGAPTKPSRGRVPVGVLLGIALAVVVAVGIGLFLLASHAGDNPPANAPTTGGSTIVLTRFLLGA